MNKSAFNSIRLTEAEKQESVQATAAFEAQLAQLPKVGEAGFFGPDSMTWKIYREPTMLLGGISALLLQIAHPAIAEGVRKFSNFHEEYLYRAHRTFNAMAGFYFGSEELALNTARRLFQMHGMIRGNIGKKTDGWWQVEKFCARDPELLTWVLATLVETSLRITELVHGPLPRSEKAQFFEESKIIATLMGIPAEVYPDDLTAFEKYYQIMLESNTLQVTPTNMRLSKIILDPPYGSNRIFRAMAAVFLPEKFAQEYQLLPSYAEKKWINRFVRFLRFALKFMPEFIRFAPPYHQANWRRTKARKKWHTGYFYTIITRHFKFPFGIKVGESTIALK